MYTVLVNYFVCVCERERERAGAEGWKVLCVLDRDVQYATPPDHMYMFRG